MNAPEGPANAGPHAVVVEKLVKKFGETTALDGVSFSVPPGELFGFIGPDGAGKTTLFRTLVTLLAPSSGRASVLGLDPVREYHALRKRVGYMAGRFSLYLTRNPPRSLCEIASTAGVARPSRTSASGNCTPWLMVSRTCSIDRVSIAISPSALGCWPKMTLKSLRSAGKPRISRSSLLSASVSGSPRTLKVKSKVSSRPFPFGCTRIPISLFNCN